MFRLNAKIVDELIDEVDANKMPSSSESSNNNKSLEKQFQR